MATSLPVAYRAVVPRYRNEAIAPRPTVDSHSTGRCAAEPVLAVAIVALALGLAAVLTSLVPASDETRAQPHRARRLAIEVVLAVKSPRLASHDRARARPRAQAAAGAPLPTVFPPGSAGGPWISPLYPQNNVTLWDRIRVSTRKDRRAYLMGTAIQLHAPEAAATPGARRAYPSKEG